MTFLYIDFETRSTQELRGQKSVGVYNYVRHPSTEPLMLSWAINDDPVEVWQPHLGTMPSILKEKLDDPEVRIVAFNSTFERYVLNFKLGFNIPIERFEDPQPSARYLSLPGDLEDVSTILGLPKDKAKDSEGSRLIKLFCSPHKNKKKRGEAITYYYHDWNSDPEDWAKFVEYCRMDTVAEREVLRREKLLQVWPLPEKERKIWEFDQRVNDRGLPICRQFVTNALALATREKEEKIQINNGLTGLENSNSNDQMKGWAVSQGYNGRDPEDDRKYSLNKDVVKSELKNNPDLTPLCRQVLEIRQSASSTSYKKMAAILRQVSPDDRVRNQFQYMGSSRCGRWSGAGLQFHNMARPIEMFEDEETVDEARAMIYNMDYDGIRSRFIDPVTNKPLGVLLTVKSNIRTAFVTKPPYRFNVSDLNAIETRVGAWVAQCAPLMEVFALNRDPYLDFANKMTNIPYEILARDVKSKDPIIKAAAKKHRQIAKPGVLGCIYRMSAATLLEYAENMGVFMTMAQAEEVVRVFREAYKEIVHAWFQLEEKIQEVMEGDKVVRYFGPNNCIKIDKYTFTCNGNVRTILRLHLPSGRKIHYVDASWEDTLMPWPGKDGAPVYRKALNYAAQDQKTKQWTYTTSHGGKVFENIVQGMARDVLAEKLLMFEDVGLWVVGHVHDEGITETKDDIFSPGLIEMDAIMAKPVLWAPGLPLASDGFEGLYYHK